VENEASADKRNEHSAVGAMRAVQRLPDATAVRQPLLFSRIVPNRRQRTNRLHLRCLVLKALDAAVSLKLCVANWYSQVVVSRGTDSETQRLVSFFEGEAVGRHAFGTFIEVEGGKASQNMTALGALSSCIVVVRHDPPHGTAEGARIDCIVMQMSITLDSAWMTIRCPCDLHAEILGSQESATCRHSTLLMTCLGLSVANATWHGIRLFQLLRQSQQLTQPPCVPRLPNVVHLAEERLDIPMNAVPQVIQASRVMATVAPGIVWRRSRQISMLAVAQSRRFSVPVMINVKATSVGTITPHYECCRCRGKSTTRGLCDHEIAAGEASEAEVMEAKRNLGRMTMQDGNAALPSPFSNTGNAEGDNDIYMGLEIESGGDDDVDVFGALDARHDQNPYVS
jgi:hypothetical protein